VNMAVVRESSSSTRVPAAVQPAAGAAAPRRKPSGDAISAATLLEGGAARAAPADGLDHVKRAFQEIAHKNYRAALGALSAALELEPGNEEARKWQLVCRARILVGEGKREEAVQVYQELLAIDPNHHEASKEVSAFQKEKKLKGIPFGRYFVKGPESPGSAPRARDRKKSDR